METPGIEPGSSSLLHYHLFIVIAKLACKIISFNLSLAMSLKDVVDFNMVRLTFFVL
ncbi:hypothetical protein HCTETULN_128 [Candidatus Hodgkinia cicadicola]|nr:hypothetical protein HCTETULN_128 [Candidatus Hodgkinia cicadicola]